MTSIEEFYFRYYANRLLREGHITEKEYQGLFAANQLSTNDCKQHSPAANTNVSQIT